MTQEIRTITIGAGQARPRRRSQKNTRRRVRLNGWTVAKYAALTVAGVLLFRAGAAYALTERGYADRTSRRGTGVHEAQDLSELCLDEDFGIPQSPRGFRRMVVPYVPL